MVEVVRGEPDRLEDYTEQTLPAVVRARAELLRYSEALAAFNSAQPNDLGTTLTDHTPQLDDTLARLDKLDIIPAAFAWALGQADQAAWTTPLGPEARNQLIEELTDARLQNPESPDNQVAATAVRAFFRQYALQQADDFLGHEYTRRSLAFSGLAREGQTLLGAARWTGAQYDATILRAMQAAETWISTRAARLWKPIYEGWTGRDYTGLDRVRARVAADYAPAFERITQRLDDATDLMRHGRGVIRVVSEVAGPIAVALDLRTAAGNTPYTGARGVADRMVSGVAAVGGTYAVLSTAAPALTAVMAAAVPALPVIMGAAVIVGVAWGATNLLVDNWDDIEEGAGNAVETVGRFFGIAT